MIKIAFVISDSGLPVPASMGGAIENLVTLLVQENEKKKKFNFIVISNYIEGKINLKENFKFKNTKFYFLSKIKVQIKIFNYFYKTLLLKIFRNLQPINLYYCAAAEILYKENPDYVIIEGGDYEKTWIIAKLLGYEKTIIHIHHHLLCNEKYEKIFSKSISVSNFIKNEWDKNINVPYPNSFMLKNSINEKLFIKKITKEERKKIRISLGLCENDFIVFYCGRLIKEKGVKELISAFNLILNIDIKLLIIGNSSFGLNYKTDYENEIINSQFNNKIKVLGYIDNSDLYKYYQCVNIQVIPSIWEEAAGLVAIEGMVSGLPLIVTNSGGMVEYVKANFAYIVERNEFLIENIAEKIMNLYNNPVLLNTMSNNAIKEAENYNMSKYYEDFNKIFEQIDKKNLN